MATKTVKMGRATVTGSSKALQALETALAREVADEGPILENAHCCLGSDMTPELRDLVIAKASTYHACRNPSVQYGRNCQWDHKGRWWLCAEQFPRTSGYSSNPLNDLIEGLVAGYNLGRKLGKPTKRALTPDALKG